MAFFAREDKLDFENNLPQVSIEHLSKYNKSKLVIKDQWASHPTTEDRIEALRKLNIIKTVINSPASALFQNYIDTETRITGKLFSTVAYNDEPEKIDDGQFIAEFTKKYYSNSFNAIYNNYYNAKSLPRIEPDRIEETGKEVNINELFSSQKLDHIYTLASLEADLNVLNQISQGGTGIKTFDYDGRKYTMKDISELQPKLQHEIEELKILIHHNDIAIYNHFLALAHKKGKEAIFRKGYETCLESDRQYDNSAEQYTHLVNAIAFMSETNTYEIIEQNMITVYQVEKRFKDEIERVLTLETFQPELIDEMRTEDLKKYISEKRVYFTQTEYDQDALNVMYAAMSSFLQMLSENYIRIKKEFLEYCADLHFSSEQKQSVA